MGNNLEVSMNMKSAIKATALAFIFCVVAAFGQICTSLSDTNNELFSRIYGCEAAGTIANSMGDVTEGLSWRQIEERYGPC